ncbi:MAG TPA: response regulator, partial [Candidatus Binatus sp.]|nr:response regulator [Candidatus Binatus sp.]
MRVLVVDDDEIFSKLLVEMLEDVGIGAVCTTDGAVAYELASRETYDVCIIDVRMPLILGTELADAIREDQPNARIILASAFADQALKDYSKQKGIKLLSKPFTKLQLVDSVNNAM